MQVDWSCKLVNGYTGTTYLSRTGSFSDGSHVTALFWYKKSSSAYLCTVAYAAYNNGSDSDSDRKCSQRSDLHNPDPYRGVRGRAFADRDVYATQYHESRASPRTTSARDARQASIDTSTGKHSNARSSGYRRRSTMFRETKTSPS